MTDTALITTYNPCAIYDETEELENVEKAADGRLSHFSGFNSCLFTSSDGRPKKHASRQLSSKSHKSFSQYGGTLSSPAAHRKTDSSFIWQENTYGRQWLEEVYRCECEIKVLVTELLATGESLSSISEALQGKVVTKFRRGSIEATIEDLQTRTTASRFFQTHRHRKLLQRWSDITQHSPSTNPQYFNISRPDLHLLLTSRSSVSSPRGKHPYEKEVSVEETASFNKDWRSTLPSRQEEANARPPFSMYDIFRIILFKFDIAAEEEELVGHLSQKQFGMVGYVGLRPKLEDRAEDQTV
ncbi:unnamed protein product [Schistocephalus solidus]|uniref:SOAR domain-containing protein n=1 Tax=Schistocephalus solidus TaxID=70667 RepID=A0A183SYW9_SCHSO|nr:unnamed protein product [Schistocephalus solidus]